MTLKTNIKHRSKEEKLKFAIRIFLDRFPSHANFKIAVVVVELVYPTIFHLISLSMSLDMREG